MGRVKRLIRENWLFLAVLAGLVGGFLVLRTEASPIATLDELETALQSGRPTLVELFSNT